MELMQYNQRPQVQKMPQQRLKTHCDCQRPRSLRLCEQTHSEEACVLGGGKLYVKYAQKYRVPSSGDTGMNDYCQVKAKGSHF